MTVGTVRGYTLTEKLRYDGSNPYFGVSPDGLPVFIRLSAHPISDVKRAETVLQFLSRYGQLNHPSLIKICDSWIEGRYLALVTDLADGGCLRNRLRQHGPFAGRELVSLFAPLSEATDFLHTHGVIHGNITPSNLLLRRDVPHLDVPRVTGSEFFIAFRPSYTAPEVLRHEESQQSDQYSLAACYTELRLGRPMFPVHPNDALSMINTLFQREPDLEPLPEAERDVLRKALAKDPAQRHPTCLTFVEELDRAVDRRRGS